MTAEDWAHVDKRLSGAYGQVKLTCDGLGVTLSVRPIAPRHYAIMPFVNGVHKGAWFLEDCEERRRFMCPTVRFAWKRRVIKGVSRKALIKVGIDPDRKITTWSPYWTSFKRLKSHLIKNNQEIALIKDAP